MALVMIWDPLERLLWGIAIAIAIISGIVYVNKGRKREVFNEKMIMYGFASFLISYALVRVFTFLQDYEIQGILINNVFYGDLENYTPSYEVYGKVIYIVIAMGYILFMLSFELIVKRTKYLITTILTFVLVLMIISPFLLARDIYNNVFTILGNIVFGLIIYLYMKWSRLEFKAVSSFLIYGVVFIVLGNGLGWRVAKLMEVFPLSLGPIIFILGCFLLLCPIMITPKLIPKTLYYWILTASMVAIFSTIHSSIHIIHYLDVDISFVITNIIAIIYVYLMFYLFLRHLRSAMKLEREKPSDDKVPGLLEVFARPQHVTEEEVSISKEKKVCLVCKGKLGGFNRYIYMCPDCNAFYCEKCSKALSNLENACWACNSPIDPSKPVKPFEKEKEEDIKVEEGVPKKRIPSSSSNFFYVF